MPKASKITPQEWDSLADKTALFKTKHPLMSQETIAKKVGRSHDTISRVMSSKAFSKYSDQYKKRIDALRFEGIFESDTRIVDAVKNDELTPYQLIGLSKTFYEQVFNIGQPLVALQNNSQTNVSIVRHGVGKQAYNPYKGAKNAQSEAKEDQSDVA